ncbi:MAG: hypothetical protein JOZ11_09045 [Alphaproteobacteria bacterium]|nr:hypothetical protein [Alphaproteobacteria bacterium]
MKEKLVNIVLIIGSVIFTFLVIEVSLRAYIAIQFYKGGSSIRSIFEHQLANFRNQYAGAYILGAYDPELGWVPATTFKEAIRSNGGGEVWGVTDPILAVGDSFTFGYDVSD